jgi:hypothetical protein
VRTGVCRSSGLFAVGLVCLGGLLGQSIVAGPVYAAETAPDTITVMPRSYDMPEGDFGAAAERSGPGRVVPLRIPISPAELERIKRLPGEQLGNGPNALETPPAPQPEASLKTCATNASVGFTPSDIEGAAGPTNLVVTTNVTIGVYSKTSCGVVSRVSLIDFFGAAFTIPTTQTIFDPRVVYDPRSKRFIVTAESLDSGNDDQFQYFAVSKDATGAHGWWLYRIVISEGAKTFCKRNLTGFWDYPSVGYNARRWFITANDFASGEPEESPNAATTDNGAILSIDKAPSLTGAPVKVRCFANLRFNIAPPLVLDTNLKAFFLSPGSGSGNALRRYVVDTNFPSATQDTIAATPLIKIPAWSAAPNAQQPNGQTLDSLDGRFQSASIQFGTLLWNVHTVNVTAFARWRLYKLSTSATAPIFTFTPSTVGARNDFTFNPSVATRPGKGAKAFVTFSRTIPSNPKAGRAAMLMARGPNGAAAGWASTPIATSPAEYLFANGSHTITCNTWSPRFTCRWGDYSATQIDPQNPDQAWGFNQLITGGDQFQWTTKAAEVQ